MSAWLCSDDTFDLLASYGAAHVESYDSGVRVTTEDPDFRPLVKAKLLRPSDTRISLRDRSLVAQILRAENIRSLRRLYDDLDDRDGVNDPYEFKAVDVSEIGPGLILKQIACLRYQSCENPDYDKTLACRLLHGIEKVAIRQVPGYEDAPWGWQRPEAVASV